MDELDREIIRIMRGNARITFQELGNKLGMSRVAAKKRVRKLEEKGIIRGYNTCIYGENDITMIVDIVTKPGRYEDVLKKVSWRTAFIRQIYGTTKENHIHMVAVSDSVSNLKYLTRMIRKKCGEDIEEIHCHTYSDDDFLSEALSLLEGIKDETIKIVLLAQIKAASAL